MPYFIWLPLQDISKTLVKKAFEADFIFGQFGQLECVAGSLLNLQSIAMERKEILDVFAITPIDDMFERVRAEVLEIVMTKAVTKKLAA